MVPAIRQGEGGYTVLGKFYKLDPQTRGLRPTSSSRLEGGWFPVVGASLCMGL